MSGRVSASAASAWPNGAGFVRWPGPASEAIIAEVVSAGGALLAAFALLREPDRTRRISSAS